MRPRKHRNSRIRAAIEPLEQRCLLAELGPVISEFLANNKTGLKDQDNEYSDWIEIYNPGPTVNLSGWRLTDDRDNLAKWTFPDTTLAQNQYMVVFASGKNRAVSGQQLHTNFKLDADGEYLALVKPDNTVAWEYAPRFPSQLADVSYGVLPPQTVSDTLLQAGSPASAIVPADDTLGTAWTLPGFDDSSWTSGLTGVGYARASGPLPEEVESNDSPGSANNASYNFSPFAGAYYHLGFSGTVSPGTEYDYFNIGALDVGDLITITVGGRDSARGTIADPYLELYRAGSSNVVASSNDGGPGLDCLIRRFSITIADTYYVRVRGNNSSAGSYQVGVWLENVGNAPLTGQLVAAEAEPNDTKETATDVSRSWRPVQYLSRTSGTISASSDFDVFAYQFTAGDLVTVNIDSTSTLDARVWLYDSSGAVVALEDGTSSFSSPYNLDSPIYAFIVPASGVYFVRVGAYTGTGTYNADIYLSSFTGPPVASEWDTYYGNVSLNIGPQMYGVNSSAYVRVPFTLASIPDADTLTLRVKYDDGFIAWLNGTQIAARNAPESPAWNSSATASHQSVDWEQIDITPFKGLLTVGSNVLAIHLLNVSASDPDVLIVPEITRTATTWGEPQYFTTPTPGSANQPGALGRVADTQFSVDRGFYDAPIDVVITTETPGAEIRYTLDGRAPTATTGIVYTGPVHITTTTTLRAAAYKAGYLSSNVDTHTYIFLNDVILQANGVHKPDPPPGFPAQWIDQSNVAAPGADYAMDWEVVGSPTYSSRIIDSLKSLPSLSIVMNVDDWFGNGSSGTNGIKGIYTNPTAADPDNAVNPAWERACSVELIYPDGREGFQIDAGVQIQGGASRTPTNSPKHSLRLLFKDRWGPTKLRYPLFGDGAASEFDAIILKAGYNNSWIHWDSPQRNRALYVHDQWASNTQLAMGQLSKHSTYVHLYINGLYWGLYSPMERPEADFASTYLGGDEADWDVIDNEAKLIDGNMTAWNAMMAILNRPTTDPRHISTPEGYADIQQYLDIPAFIDYMILNFYAGNWDWSNHNWYAARRSRVNGVPVNIDGFRFFSFDAERILEGVSDNRTTLDESGYPSGIFQKLRLNPEFRLAFADRVHKHFFNDGALTPQAAAARFQALADQVDLAVIAESARWGDYRRDVHVRNPPVDLYTRDVYWVAERNRLLNSYFPARTSVVLSQFRNTGSLPQLYPSFDAPEFNQHGGTFQSSFVLTIRNPSGVGTIYYTLDGTDPRFGGTVYQDPVTLDTSALVKARILYNGQWSALCEATFIVGAPPGLRISEIMYHPADPPAGTPWQADDFEFIELTNTTGQTLNLSGIRFTKGISFTFPAGATLAPGARTLLVKNQSAFQYRYGQGLPIAGVYEGELDNAGERLRIETALGQVIQDFKYNDAWFDHTDGGGYSLVAIDPLASDSVLSTKAGWRPSNPPGGGPGVDDPGYNPGIIVISEVMSNTSDPQGPWVELFNTTNADIDIGGWALSNMRDWLDAYIIPSPTIVPANGFVVFQQASTFGSAAAARPFQINPAGDRIYLSSMAGNLIGGYRESVDFGAADPGVSFGRHVKSTGKTDFYAMSTPTPGAPNSLPRIGPVVISEVMYNPPPGGHEFIELRNVTSSAVPLYDPAYPANTWKFTDGITFTFPPGASIPPQGYALVVNISPAMFRTLYSIPASVQIFGPYSGLLDNAGEKLELSKPITLPSSGLRYVVVDRVHYDDESPWPVSPDGKGPSLMRLVSSRYANDPANWFAASATPGSPNAIVVNGTDASDTFYLEAVGDTLNIYINRSKSGEPDLALPTGIDGLVINAAGGNNTLTLGTSIPLTPVFNASGGINRLELLSGVQLIDRDLGVGAPALRVSATGVGTTLSFLTSQHLGELNLYSSGKAGLTPGAGALLRTGSVSLVGGWLDLADGTLVVDATSATRLIVRDTITSLVASGRAGAGWNGPGISSSVAAGNALRHTGLAVALNDDGRGNTILPAVHGEPVNTDCVLVKYTFNGDMNLDGQVDAQDYFLIDQGFLNQPGQYRNGDIDYSGFINADDYMLIDWAYLNAGKQMGAASIVAPPFAAAPLIEAEAVMPAATSLPASSPGDDGEDESAREMDTLLTPARRLW